MFKQFDTFYNNTHESFSLYSLQMHLKWCDWDLHKLKGESKAVTAWWAVSDPAPVEAAAMFLPIC